MFIDSWVKILNPCCEDVPSNWGTNGRRLENGHRSESNISICIHLQYRYRLKYKYAQRMKIEVSSHFSFHDFQCMHCKHFLNLFLKKLTKVLVCMTKMRGIFLTIVNLLYQDVFLNPFKSTFYFYLLPLSVSLKWTIGRRCL